MEELRSDEKFLKVFNNNLVGMLLSNEQHIIIDMNDHLLSLAEMHRMEVIGKTGIELGILNEAFVKNIWEELSKTEKLLNRELVFTTKKTNRPVNCLFSTEKIELDGQHYWLTTIIDTTKRKQTEKALSEVYERVTDGFMAIDHNWHYTYVNKKAGELLGKDPAYLVGKHVWMEFPQTADDPFYLAYHRAMEKQEMTVVEDYTEAYDRWFQNLIYPSPDGLSIFLTDITSRKKAEKIVSDSELRFRTLTRNAPVGIFETDANGATTYVNQTWLLYSGMQYDEAMGDGWLNAVHPDDREWLQKGWRNKTGTKSESISEYRIIDKKGRQRWVKGNAIPVKNSNGEVTGYIGIILDITESKQAEEKISSSEESKRLILNSALDAIIIIDAASHISFWNPQAENIFGWRADEVMGKHLSETIIPPGYAEAHSSGMERYLNTGKGHILNRLIEITALNKSGVLFPVEMSILPVEMENEISFCAFIRDITERKEAEISLKRSSEQLRELSGHLQEVREEERLKISRDIHDELGQQLTGLKMDISWLKKKYLQDDPLVIDKFNDAILLVDETVKSIRRITAELRPSIIDDLGLNAALEWHINEFRDRIGIEVIYENSFDDTDIDPAISIGLFRMLQESLTNVAKHAQASQVKIKIERVNNTVKFCIQDNGVGFDMGAKQNDLSFGHMGINERVSKMKGKSSIKSKPDAGTTIEVTLPLK